MSINDFINNNNNSENISEVTKKSRFGNFKKPEIKLPSNLRKFKKNHIIGAVIAIVIILGLVAVRNFTPDATLGQINGSDARTEAPKPLATQNLNTEFEFPLVDGEGEEVAKIKYLVESANIQDAFIYKGSMATAVKGRTFLIFNIKITNPYSETIEVNTKDYIRVKVNGSEEQLAPEIHNDPVEIQANSTKYARIGLPINDNDKNIVILVGELDGDKKTIKLNLER